MFRVLHEQTDLALSESQCKQKQLEDELKEIKQRGKKFEVESEFSQKQLVDAKNELVSLKSKLKHLDCERDNALVSSSQFFFLIRVFAVIKS